MNVLLGSRQFQFSWQKRNEKSRATSTLNKRRDTKKKKKKNRNLTWNWFLKFNKLKNENFIAIATFLLFLSSSSHCRCFGKTSSKLTIMPVLTAMPRPQYVFGTISPKPTLKNVIAISHIEFNKLACSSSWNLNKLFIEINFLSSHRFDFGLVIDWFFFSFLFEGNRIFSLLFRRRRWPTAKTLSTA